MICSQNITIKVHLVFLHLLTILSPLLNAQVLCKSKLVVLSEDGRCNESPYILVFEDNFDGNKLDSTKWRAVTGVVRDLEHKIAQQWYSPANIFVSDGTLKLITRRDTLR